MAWISNLVSLAFSSIKEGITSTRSDTLQTVSNNCEEINEDLESNQIPYIESVSPYENLLKDISDAIQYLMTYENSPENELFCLTGATELQRFYEDLRSDMKDNASSLSYEDYCERIADFYCKVASFFNDEFSHAGTIDDKSFKEHLDKCSEMFYEGRYEDVYEDSQNNTENLPAEVNKLTNAVSQTSHNDKLSIDLNQDSINQFSNYRKKITHQDIQLLQIINTLEAAITMPKIKLHYQTAIQYCCLEQAYKLAGESTLSAKYGKKVEVIVSKWKHFKPENYENNKEKIRGIIEDNLQNDRNNLDNITKSIEETFHRSIDPTDLVLIEDMYIEICSNLWQKEVKETLTKFVEARKKDKMREIFYSLSSINELEEIPSPFCELKHYKLLKENINLITNDQERKLLSYFKGECCKKVISYTKDGKHELKFLEALAIFLSKTDSLKSVIKNIQLEQFCTEMISGNAFMKNILNLDENCYCKELKDLQKCIKRLNLKEDLFFIEEFKKFAKDYLKPVKPCETKNGNRTSIKIEARNITLSEVLNEIESKLSENPDIEEVRFIAIDIVHLDRDLKKAIWHGKNIIIKTKILKIHDKVTLDVSGKDANHDYSEAAKTNSNGNGEDGDDGYAGESGGHVLILTENIENAENLIIISNGGRGSTGQDGGNGRDGEHGTGISKANFDKVFPTFNSFWTLFFLNSNIENCKTEMKNNSKRFNFETCDYGEFIQSELVNGKKITFCTYSYINAYLLYEGSKGERGGDGGESGLGGEGGHCGEVNVKNTVTQESFNINIIAKYGTNGDDGNGGYHGKHGLNGWDMGYADRWFRTTQFYGMGEQSRLQLKYYTEWQSGGGCVWCPHKNKYMLMKEIPIEYEQLKTYDHRKNTRKNKDRKKHAQTNRKTNICEQTILNEYSKFDYFKDREMIQNLQSDLKNLIQLADVISDNQKQEAEITTEVSVSRQVRFYKEKTKQTNENNSIRVSSEQTTSFERLTEELTGIFLNDWQRLKSLPLNRSQCDEIDQIFRKPYIQNHFDERALNNIANLLKEKYLFANLQEISGKITFKRKIIPSRLTSVQAERYLLESKEPEERFSHRELGRLNQYLFEDGKKNRTQLIKFCRKEFKDEKCDDFLESVKSFILEIGSKNKAPKIIKKFYNKYKALNVTEIFDVFINERSHSKNTQLYDLWMGMMEDKCLEAKLKKELQKDEFLQNIYYRHKVQKVRHWYSCFKNGEVQNAYYNYMENKGLQSRAYWDLLAYTFEVNIRLYVYDQDKKFLLLDEYCTSCSNCVHVLSKADRLILLEIDKNYLELEDKRINEDKEYGEIFREVEQLNTKTEVQTYFEEKFSSFNASSKTFITVLKGHFQRKIEDIKVGFDLIKFQYRGHVISNEHITNNAVSTINETPKNEDQLITRIAEYFPEVKREIESRLKKLKLQYTGQEGILNSLFRRFLCEGRHVSYDEICHLINAVLSSCVENRKEKNTFAWIIAAYSQNQWIDQLILLQIENHFRNRSEQKTQWQEYLSNIRKKDILLLMSVKLMQSKSVSVQCINDVLHLLSNIPNEFLAVEGLELSEWPYALKDKYWAHKLRLILNCQQNYDEDLQKASYYVISMENIFGEKLVENLFQVISEKKEKFRPSNFIEMLSNFYSEQWILTITEIEMLRKTTIKKWDQEMQLKFHSDDKDRNISKLVELVKGNTNSSENIVNNLKLNEEDVKTISENNYEIDSKKVCAFRLCDVERWLSSTSKDEKDILAIIDKTVKIKKNFKLRDTQKLTILTLLRNEKSILAQVSTGEGKSLIVVAVSIIKALRGETVDVVTSSSVLAIRDAKEYKDIYAVFNITVGYNCSEKKEDRRKAYSNQVVYGELSSFQRDYLLDKFYDENILGDRQLKNVIVDEVDSMLLDQGNNMIYLSHKLEDFDKLESVYIYIWQWINRPALTWEQVSHVLNKSEIKEAILVDMYGAIFMEDLAKLGSDLEKNQQKVIWEGLVNSGIIRQDGKILIQSGDDLSRKLHHLKLQQDCISYKNRLHFLLKERLQRQKRIHVPNYLKPFIELHLEKWIENAITAMCMQVNHDYVVDVDRTGSSPDRNSNIIILDRDTGTDQSNCQWEQGLHQFLQLKHGCKLSLQCLKAVFISNVSFFKLYDKLYGLTGTLGSQCERDLLKDIHGVDFVTIPTAKTKQFDEDPPIICASSTEWIEQITTSVKNIAENRSVLIICDTVEEVKQLDKAFRLKKLENVHSYSLFTIHTYTRDYEKFEIADKAEQRHVIIATNLAGRGTDIKISDRLREAGGLHVCLTYLPKNIRIEQQAFGRAARSGNKGSGQLIIFDVSKLPKSFSKILHLKKKRDSDELNRLSEIRNHYETQIIPEENSFKTFKERYIQLKRELVAPKEIKDILLRCCLDKWAFWLDANGKSVTENNFERQLSTLISEYILNPSHCVEENPVQMTNLAKYLTQNNKLDDAIDLFNKVIRNEPEFCGAAHYYKAFALTKKNDWDKRIGEFKDELLEAAKLFDQHINTATFASSVISKMKRNTNNLLQLDSYEEQKRSVCTIYLIFLKSIDEILGHCISAEDFRCENVKYDLAERIYEELRKKGYLRKPIVNENKVNEQELKPICYDYGLEFDAFKDFLSSYKEREINETDFEKELKNKIQLPSRENFWKTLLNADVLSEKVKFVVIEDDKLKQFDSELFKLFDKHKLKEQLLMLNQKEELMLYEEFISHQEKNKCIYRKEDLLKIIKKDKYKLLKRMGILTTNKKARFDVKKCAGLKFGSYDSICPDDLIKRLGFNEDEAKQILSELVHQNVIVKENESRYSLRSEIEHFMNIKIHFCPLYEDSVKELLLHCFSYTIQLQMIEKHINDENYRLHQFLKIKPHQSLNHELLAKKIIIAPKINSTKDVNLLLNSTVNKLTDAKQYRHIINILQSKRSALETLEVVNASLQTILEVIDISSHMEASTFILNGLEHILKLEEKKWTWKMIFSSCATILLGIVQVFVGCVFEFVSTFNTALINEGLADIVCGIKALVTGFFRWGDYFKQKIQSVLISASTAFIEAIAPKVFGRKSFGSAVNNERMMETCQRSVINVSFKKVTEQIGKRCALKILHASAYGAVNMTLNSWLPNSLQSLSDKIAESVLFDIENKVTNHSVMNVLKEAVARLGAKKTKEIIQIATESVFNKQAPSSSFYSSMGQLLNTLSEGFLEIMSKYKFSEFNLDAIDNVIRDILGHIGHLLTVCNPGSILTEFLDDVEESLMPEMNEARRLNKWREVDDDSEKLLQEISAQWIASTQEELSRILLTEVINPVFNTVGKYMFRYIENEIKNTYASYSENESNIYFDKNKQNYHEKMTESISDEKNKESKPMENMYSKELLNLTKQTQNPVLFANIIRENVAMNMTFINASIQVVHSVLNQIGSEIGTLQFIVKDENGVYQKFTSKRNGTESKFIEINLQNNYFYISRNEETLSNSNTETKNNCLFDSLSKEIKSLETITPLQFKDLIADRIEKDRDIHCHLKDVWRRTPNDLVVYGYGKEGNESVAHDQPHLFSHITSLKWGMMTRRIKETIEIQVDDRSNLNHDRKTTNKNIHNHLPESIFINKKKLVSCNELLNMLNDIQNVRKYVNMASRDGQNIDKIHHDLMRIAAEIDFIKCFDDIFVTKIINVKSKSGLAINQVKNKEKCALSEKSSAKDNTKLNDKHNKMDNALRNIKNFYSTTTETQEKVRLS